MKAYVLIKTAPGRSLEVASKLQSTEGIAAVDAVTGEYDVIAVCQGADVNAIAAVSIHQIQKLEGVYRTITCLTIR